MKTTLRVVCVALALCFVVLPPLANANMPVRECCDVAHELMLKQDEYDANDDRLDYLLGVIRLCNGFIEQIHMRDPFTPEDQEAIDDITRVVGTCIDEMVALEATQSALALEIISLNQELLTCVPISDDGGPLTPIPAPLPMNP